MKCRPRRLLTNPLVLVVPLVLLLILGWRHYTYAGLALNVALPNHNLLPNGTFSHLRGTTPVGWQFHSSGDLSYRVTYSMGYVSGNTLNMRVTRYSSGDVTLTTPKVSLSRGKTYLFKGYYKTAMQFALLARYYYGDGTSQLRFLQYYRDSPGTWSTVSDAFNTRDTVTAVQYVYDLSSPGLLQINGVYVEATSHVHIVPPVIGDNLLPNSLLTVAGQVNMPDHWQPYRSGDNMAAFSYGRDATGAYFSAMLSQYRNGEAKWQYTPQPVQPHQYYQFTVTYRSNKPVYIVGEYSMQDGTRQFATLQQILPSDDWTATTAYAEVPPGAMTMTIAAVLQQAGTLDTRGYSLIRMTKPGALHWQRPLVSIAFDDGWQSAYTTGVPLLHAYGYAATFYINPSSIETPDFMSAIELNKLHAAGDEIAAHGYAHDDLVNLNEEAVAYQLYEGKRYLDQAGYSVTDLATPYGDSDAEVQWYARQDFQTVRSTETGLNTRQNFDRYNLKILYVDTSVKNQDVVDALRQAKQYNGWLILVYHRVGSVSKRPATSKVENTTVTVNAFSEQLRLLKMSNITVMPVSAAYAEIAGQS